MSYIHHQYDDVVSTCPFPSDYEHDVVAKNRYRDIVTINKHSMMSLTRRRVISAVSLSVHRKNSSGFVIPILSQTVFVISATVALSST